MPIPSRDELRDLWSREGECVSILLPTQRAGNEVQQGKIRLKNLLREAEERLGRNGLRKDQVEAALRPGHELLADEERWRSIEDGLAVYLAPGVASHFTVPVSLEETLVTGSRFYLLPLLPLLESRGDFLVLALSLNEVRLLGANRFEVREIDLPGVPKNLSDTVESDDDAIVHGHGVGQGDGKEEATRFCQRVDAGLRRILQARGNGSEPLVIAAAEPLASMYAQTTHYANVAPEALAGNPEHLSPEDLRAQAWPIIERSLARMDASVLDRGLDLLGTGRASTDAREIVLAANDGRIDDLFVAQGARLWGSFDPAARSVEVEGEPSDSADELLNLAACLTMRASGSVRLVAREAMPEQAHAAALFRY